MSDNQLLYLQITSQIIDRIKDHTYKEGDKLPSEPKLAQMFNVSRDTIRKALLRLASDDYIYTVKGSGSFVRTAEISSSLVNVFSFSEIAKQHQKSVSSKIINFNVSEPTTNIQHKLNIPDGELTYEIIRIRIMDDLPVMLEKAYMPVSLFSDFSYDKALGSRYSYIESKGYKIKQNNQKISSVLSSNKKAQLLNIPSGSPLLKVESFATLSDNTVFEYTISHFIPGYSFDIVSNR